MKLSKEITELLKHSSWSFFGTIISRALMFFTWVYIANYFGKETNGEIGILRSTINLFISFGGVGFGLTLTKFIPQYIDNNKKELSKIISATLLISFFLSIVISTSLYVFSNYITSSILNRTSLLIPLQTSSFLIFFSILNGVLFGFLQGFQKFKQLSFVNIINGVSLLLFLIIFSKRFGVIGVFIGFTLSTLLTLIISLFYVIRIIKEEKIILSFNIKSELTFFYTFTIPAIMSGLMVVPFKWTLDSLMVNQKDGYATMGLFTAIFLFHSLILMVINTINAPMITLMSKQKASKNIKLLNILIPWALGILISVPLLLFPQILGILFGEEYLLDIHFKKTTILIVITTTIVLYKNGLSRIMIVNNLMWFSFFSNLLWGIVLILTFYFNNEKDSVSMAFAYVLAYLINILIIFPIYIKRKIIPIFLVYSKESILVWLIYFSLIWIALQEINIFIYKLITLLIYWSIFVILFYKMLTYEKKN